jgi:D-tagatose-1,6-bisphosphate aldolase subunit GatZ/KbaZ
MVEDHFAILKVGPWLTFALREALFALEAMEREWLGSVAISGAGEMGTDPFPSSHVRTDATLGATGSLLPVHGPTESTGRGVQLSDFRQTLEATMLRSPANWKPYYRGDEQALRFARAFSYSDRCRYYLPDPGVDAAIERLLTNLAQHPVPLTLLDQYLPVQYQAVREGRLANTPRDLVLHKIMEVTGIYARACTP